MREMVPSGAAGREREVFCILCLASTSMNVPGFVKSDNLMNAPSTRKRRDINIKNHSFC